MYELRVNTTMPSLCFVSLGWSHAFEHSTWFYAIGGSLIPPVPKTYDVVAVRARMHYKNTGTEKKLADPAPHPDLTRQEAALLRQLQGGATWTPVWAVHVTSEQFVTDQCAVCGAARATMTHMMWECNDADAETNILPPHLARGVRETDKDAQKAAAQFALAAITRQQSRSAPPS